MLTNVKRLFGDENEKTLKRLWKRVADINALEPDIQALSDDALRAKTDEFKQRLSDGETTDDLMPEAFAVVREAARRTLGERTTRKSNPLRSNASFAVAWMSRTSSSHAR